MDEVTVAPGAYTLPDCGFTAPEGKQFKEWQITYVNGNPTTENAGTEITVSENIVLVAQWAEVNPKTGDAGNTVLWIVLLFVSCGAIFVTMVDKKKKVM